MRRFLRCLLLLLITFAVPVAGWANGVGYSAQRCPMMAGELAGMHSAKVLPDCCADMATMAKTGSPCKAGQECKMGSLAQFDRIAIFVPVKNAPPLSCLPTHALLATHSACVWRPPRQV